MSASLVGSEMCIRDSPAPATARSPERTPGPGRIRAIYDEVARSLQSGDDSLTPEARPFLGNPLRPVGL
eukprot:8179456-Alexandrium_andersonii.AAC.1